MALIPPKTFRLRTGEEFTIRTAQVEDAAAMLAEASGTIIGSSGFENGPHRRVAHRGSFGIGVVKEWRGRGVGTALMGTLLE